MDVISFVNMKGGVGKTTLAVNVADFLVERHSKRVLFIDMDPQFNATQCLMNNEEYIQHIDSKRTTVVDIFKTENMAAVSVVRGITTTEERPFENIKPYRTIRKIDLIPGRLDLFRLEMAPGQGTEMRLKNYLKYIEEVGAYDICIIDCPPTPSVWMTSALIASDYYLIPSRPDPISMTGLDLLDTIIRERKANYGCACKCIGLVMTVVEKKLKLYDESRRYFSQSDKWKDYLYKYSFLKRVAVPRGQLNGVFISDIDDIPLKREFAGIVQELLARMEGNNGK